MSMNPKYPVYIISKGRWESRLTSKAFEKIGVPYHIVVEKQEFDKYASVIDPSKILILPQEYKDNYDVFSDFDNKVTGSGPARNFCLDHSISIGAKWHWLFDDNIRVFYILNNNKKIRAGDGTMFRLMEYFCELYENIAIAGPNYQWFAKQNQKIPQFIINTRIYSMLFIRNDIPYRWRGRYNEDVDLSLRILKDGWCTAQFNMFLGDKMTTQVIKGGNTEELYGKGTYAKSKMIVDMHPDVATMVWKFGRCHHHVDYEPFKKNKLKRKDVIPDNPYKLKLINRNDHK
jgi:hypothetical protein